MSSKNANPSNLHRPDVPTSRAAKASLILSLFFLFCGPFTSLPAIVLGFFGVLNVRESRGALKGEGLALAGLAIGGIGLMIWFGMLVGAMTYAGHRLEAYANQEVQNICAENLEQIHAALESYREANGGAYPAELQSLCPDYLEDFQLYCGSDVTPVTETDEEEVASSYTYAAPPAGANPAETVVVEDKGFTHTPPSKNVLYADGRVESVPKPGASR